jgi:TonB family protein
MGGVRWLTILLLGSCCAALAQQTAPANETRNPVTVRSPHSHGADLTVPLCPAHFHDSLSTDGIASPHQAGVTPPKAIRAVPARLTEDAVRTAGKTHVGNFHVILSALVDAHGNPSRICLEKSAGYGLDGSAAAAVRRYHFQPAVKNGKPVPMRIRIEVPFVATSPPPAPGPIPAKPRT